MTSVAPRRCSAARLAPVFLFMLTACGPLGGSGGAARLSVPSSTKGDVAFTPPDGATELDPARTEVVVRTVSANAHLKSVTVVPDTGPALDARLKDGALSLKQGLRTDARYVVTAVAAVRRNGDTADTEETQTSTFSTATTPKIVSTNPLSIGPGQLVVLTLNPPASSVSVTGPVRGQLGPDGTTVTVIPVDFKQGQTYTFKLIARSLRGIKGSAQAAIFTTLPPATAAAYPDTAAATSASPFPSP